eukprot:g346.t1
MVAVFALPPLRVLAREKSSFGEIARRFVGVGADARRRRRAAGGNGAHAAQSYRAASLRVLLHWIEAGWVVRGVTAGLSPTGACLGGHVRLRHFGGGTAGYLELDADVSSSSLLSSLFGQLYNRGPELDLAIGLALVQPSERALAEASARRAAAYDAEDRSREGGGTEREGVGEDDGKEEDEHDAGMFTPAAPDAQPDRPSSPASPQTPATPVGAGSSRMQTLNIPAGIAERLVFDVFPGTTLCWKFVVEEIGADVGFER